MDEWIEREGLEQGDLGAIWVRPPRHVTERRAGPSWIVRFGKARWHEMVRGGDPVGARQLVRRAIWA